MEKDNSIYRMSRWRAVKKMIGNWHPQMWTPRGVQGMTATKKRSYSCGQGGTRGCGWARSSKKWYQGLINYYDQKFRNDSSSTYGRDQKYTGYSRYNCSGCRYRDYGDMQAAVVNRALRTKHLGGWQPPKYLPTILKGDIIRKEEMQRNHFPGWPWQLFHHLLI